MESFSWKYNVPAAEKGRKAQLSKGILKADTKMYTLSPWAGIRLCHNLSGFNISVSTVLRTWPRAAAPGPAIKHGLSRPVKSSQIKHNCHNNAVVYCRHFSLWCSVENANSEIATHCTFCDCKYNSSGHTTERAQQLFTTSSCNY